MPIYEDEEVTIIERKPYWTLGRILTLLLVSPIIIFVAMVLYAAIVEFIEVQLPTF